jgi:hypothetical protein
LPYFTDKSRERTHFGVGGAVAGDGCEDVVEEVAEAYGRHVDARARRFGRLFGVVAAVRPDGKNAYGAPQHVDRRAGIVDAR